MSQPSNKRGKKKDDVKTDAWLASYGDLMTLLCTFFILLLSFSNIEVAKFKRFMSSLQGSSGVLGEQDGSSIVQKEMSKPDLAEINQDVLKQFIEGLENENEALMEDGGVTFEQTDDGLIIRIGSPLLFESGGDILKIDSYPILKKIADLINIVKCNVRVVGHTDNRPIHSVRFPSNWDLSAARAMVVLKYFVNTCYVNPRIIEAVGKGQYDPIASNDILEERRRNRRVEILLSFQYKTGEELLKERQPL